MSREVHHALTYHHASLAGASDWSMKRAVVREPQDSKLRICPWD